MQKLRPIMIVGTCSDAGKSVINTALCRIFKQDGFHPAPFKAQNMSLNSYSTLEGGEMGRAQVVQAEACGIAPHTDMNPILLKPTTDKSSQVVLNGRAIGNMSASAYFNKKDTGRELLFQEAVAAFNRLDKRFNPIVLEGAGSISELNLRDRDITNMRMALQVNAATYLVADIDRGGVIASVYGTIALLTSEEKECIKGIIINKFRGDISLFNEGRRIIEELTGIPVVGVIPWFNDIRIEEEDSVSLSMKQNSFKSGKINVAIILLRRMSNFTDFDVLEMDPRFNVFYTNNIEEIEKADVILLPGSKNTIADLQHLKANGIADCIVKAAKRGRRVVGICGGYQMMGMRILDPEQLEGNISTVNGLGLLPIQTIIEEEKTTRQDRFTFLPAPGSACKGYEIHMGKTSVIEEAEIRPLIRLSDDTTEGCLLDRNCWGSYMHGILDNPTVLDYLAEGLSVKESSKTFDYAAFKEEQYDKLAAHVRRNIDMQQIYTSLLIR